MSAGLAARNDVPTCHGGLENLDTEYDYEIESIDGRLPSDLIGTFFRNGPGRQRIGTQRYGHWFDGDGMVCAFSFDGARARFRNRYVRTPKYLEETAAQAIRYRGFGTQVPGGLARNLLRLPANPANTNTVWHGGHLLALNEGGKPWELSPADLSTIGEFDYAGGLHGGDVFSAHGKIHPGSGDYFNFGAGIAGIGLRGPKPCLTLYRINANGKLVQRVQHPLDRFPFCHDFVITDRYAVFFVGSIVFGNMLPVILGSRSIANQVHFDATVPMRIVVLDLQDFRCVREFETGPGAAIHFGNAYAQGDTVIVDAMFTDNFEANRTLVDVFAPTARFGGGQYLRYELNLANGRMMSAQVVPGEHEFPTFDTRRTGSPTDVTYTACSVANGADSFFNAIARVTRDGEMQQLTLPAGTYGSEPLFVPRAGGSREDDGYLLEVVYDGYRHRSELQIYRAENLDRVATLQLPHHIPHQFHGHFTPQVFAPSD